MPAAKLTSTEPRFLEPEWKVTEEMAPILVAGTPGPNMAMDWFLDARSLSPAPSSLSSTAEPLLSQQVSPYFVHNVMARTNLQKILYLYITDFCGCCGLLQKSAVAIPVYAIDTPTDPVWVVKTCEVLAELQRSISLISGPDKPSSFYFYCMMSC